MNVFSLPIGRPFLAEVVKGLLGLYQGRVEDLSDVHLLLPTRRACRVATDLFLDLADGRPLLLPRLRAIADIDDAELELMVTAETGVRPDFLPAISAMERQIVLTEMIRKRDPAIDYARAAGLGRALGEFMDRVADEELTLDRLDTLVPDEYAEHWQLTLTFLSILRTVWPGYLQARGLVDASVRRGLLLRALARHWEVHPPEHPVIVAGVTGSLPAVAELMRVVAQLSQGAVILPGFDPYTDGAGQDDPQHPHYELYRVLAKLEVSTTEIRPWLGMSDRNDPLSLPRSFFWGHVMRSASLCDSWADLRHDPMAARVAPLAKNLRMIECRNPREEAVLIAMHARKVLEIPDSRLVVVTPDRALAREIIAACARFGIEVNDSAGEPLEATPSANFLFLWVRLVIGGCHPVDLVSLLRHPLFFAKDIGGDLINRVDRLARGVRPSDTFQGFFGDLIERGMTPQDQKSLRPLFDDLRAFSTLVQKGKISIPDIAAAHLRLAERWSCESPEGGKALWNDEAGEALSSFFRDLLSPDLVLSDIDGADYSDLLTHLMSGRLVNRRGVGHPRLALLGIFESRLVAGSHVVLAGMNEGDWPPGPRVDPWLSRRMQIDFGLPADEVRTGRLAADFFQLVQTSDVMMTRSQRVSGAITVPSRWWQRVETVLPALGVSLEKVRDQALASWVSQLDSGLQVGGGKIQRPAPRPPVHARPTQMSATNFETLMRNPYAFYARKSLRLYPLDPYDRTVDGRIRGTILHRALERFLAQDPGGLSFSSLVLFLEEELKKNLPDQAVRAALFPRLLCSLRVFFERNRLWCEDGYTAVAFEKKWAKDLQIGGTSFRLTARLDRLDRHINGRYAVIDYKTGSNLASLADMSSGLAPQLPIEAWLVEQGMTEDQKFSDCDVDQAVLWPIQARPTPLKIVSIDDLEKLRGLVERGVRDVLGAYHQQETPYYPVPDPDRAPEYDDYRQLSRQDEWWGQAPENGEVGA